MSAFLCSNLHTHILAARAVRDGLATDPLACAELLRDANNAALAARYGDSPAALGDPERKLTDDDLSHAFVNVQARCFAYQCSQGDVMETHPAAPLLEALIERTGGYNKPKPDGIPWGV